MDLWTIIGIISSISGIYSFIKNDTALFKKVKKVTHYITNTSLKKIAYFGSNPDIKKIQIVPFCVSIKLTPL
jgi:hypothetical protein